MTRAQPWTQASGFAPCNPDGEGQQADGEGQQFYCGGVASLLERGRNPIGEGQQLYWGEAVSLLERSRNPLGE
ncbi:MAG TPA: hypothetical protein VFN23_13310 [Ktedonobacteraceae bacterium]|nr:hypothetical protein [Ktedonobacteraceae bacterium]